MRVDPNDNLFTIADLSTIWIVADVYEFELPWVELGQVGRVELGYLPGKAFFGLVSYIAPFLDPKTRTAEVRLELPNPHGELKPGMFGNTIIEAAPREQVTALPSEAVLHSGRRTLAIVALGGGRFESRELELGLDSGDGWTEVRAGLAPGEEVVVSGQFLIDSESKLQDAVQKLVAPAVPGDPGADAATGETGRDPESHEMGH
jgi:Cu(I)/Ag(I) efflux system membrane fusion protein/cobalt-zinc-cadmium efflux system membrane fusion protein